MIYGDERRVKVCCVFAMIILLKNTYSSIINFSAEWEKGMQWMNSDYVELNSSCKSLSQDDTEK